MDSSVDGISIFCVSGNGLEMDLDFGKTAWQVQNVSNSRT